jgi:hypothetical protein
MASASEDDELLRRFAGGDADAFVQFYRRHLAAILGFFLRRTGDAELTADLTAEVFAAALLAAERFEPGERPALAWLYGIAAHKLSDSRRRGRVEDRARRRLGLERLEIDDADLEQQATGGVCLMFYGPNANGGTCGATASELNATGLISSISPLSGVVPDGVASVSVEYPGKAKTTQRTVTVGVVGNVFVTRIVSSSVFGHEQPKMIWRSAGGEIIKTVSAGPRDRPTRGFCQSKSSNGC